MKVTIVSPEKTLYEGEVEGVKLPGTLGRFEVLKGHAPIISTLVAGTVECACDEQNHNITKKNIVPCVYSFNMRKINAYEISSTCGSADIEAQAYCKSVDNATEHAYKQDIFCKNVWRKDINKHTGKYNYHDWVDGKLLTDVAVCNVGGENVQCYIEYCKWDADMKEAQFDCLK